MVQTRQSTQSDKDAPKDAPKDASKAPDTNNKENEPPAGTPQQQRNKAPAIKGGSKRKLGLGDSVSNVAKPNKRKASGTSPTAPTPKPTKKEDKKESNEANEQNNTPSRPRLTTPDLEFDYDRTQLRDPRPTPGRNARPRYDSYDMPGELKAQLEATREIPKPDGPKGRRRADKDRFAIAEARMNPLSTFHDLHRCYDKGRDGSPTYDEAGFQLDYDKVADWMKPKAYSKKGAMSGMDKSIKESERKRKEMYDLFFEKSETDPGLGEEHYVKDRISKDLGVPWHQIGPEHAKTWRDKGFKPVKYKEWWTEPTEEESKRWKKMMRGASLRKHL